LLSAAPVSRIQLPFYPGEQVVDVVALQHAVAECLQDLAPGSVAAAAVDERVPFCGELVHLGLVRVALRLDRETGGVEACLPGDRGRAVRAGFADVVELL